MTFVVELRDLKKSPPRPIAHFRHHAAQLLCVLRGRPALVGLLGFALDYSFDSKAAPSGGVLALLCGVLSAAEAATLRLLEEVSVGLYTLFGDDASPLFRLGQRLDLCFGQSVFASDLCAEGSPFPEFSRHCAVALVTCALLVFGGGLRQREPAKCGTP